jgi:hypothetical protein
MQGVQGKLWKLSVLGFASRSRAATPIKSPEHNVGCLKMAISRDVEQKKDSYTFFGQFCGKAIILKNNELKGKVG